MKYHKTVITEEGEEDLAYSFEEKGVATLSMAQVCQALTGSFWPPVDMGSGVFEFDHQDNLSQPFANVCAPSVRFTKLAEFGTNPDKLKDCLLNIVVGSPGFGLQ